MSLGFPSWVAPAQPQKKGGVRRICVDADGVMFRTTDAVLELINYKYGTSFTAYDCTQWFWWELPKFAEAGVTKDDFWLAYRMIHKNRWTDVLKPYDKDTLRVLRRLQSNFDVSVLTARAEKDMAAVEDWLAKHRVYGIPVRYPKFGQDVRLDEKMYYDWDVLIDDAPSLVKKMIGGTVSRKKTLIVPTTPWNREAVEMAQDEGATNVKVVESWGDIDKIFFGEG